MMKKLLLIAFIIPLLVASCGSDEAYKKMPQEVNRFITQYWPDPWVESCEETASGGWVVILHNGPTISFDAAEQWTSINGNGLPLGGTLLYDQLPEVLYDYLESGTYLGQVFTMSRNTREYKVELLNIRLTYDISTETVRQESGELR